MLAQLAIGQGYENKYYVAIEVFGGVGTTHYFGDVGGPSYDKAGIRAIIDNFGIDIDQTRTCISGGIRYLLKQNLGVTAQLTPMIIAGNDAKSTKYLRGYHFYSQMIEGNVALEWYLANRFTGNAPYLFVGGGGLVYRYKNNILPNFSKLYTTGNIMLGVGYRFDSKNSITHAVEVGFRYALSDNLDNFKGPTNTKDTYFTMSYRINFDLARTFFYDYRGRVKK